MSEIILTGRHPYQPDLEAELRIQPLDVVPGRVVTALEIERGAVPPSERENAWVHLAGSYVIAKGLRGTQKVWDDEARSDRQAMLACLWDFLGEPIFPGGPRRRPARVIVVRDGHGDGLGIYRNAHEVARIVRPQDYVTRKEAA